MRGFSERAGVYELQKRGGKEKALTEKDDESPTLEENCFIQDLTFQ